MCKHCSCTDIAASTNCQNDEHILPRRNLAALKTLFSNHNIIISPFDKGGDVVMDSTVYSQKILDLLNDNSTNMNRSLNKLFKKM